MLVRQAIPYIPMGTAASGHPQPLNRCLRISWLYTEDQVPTTVKVNLKHASTALLPKPWLF